MAVNLFEMFDNFKNSQQMQSAGTSMKNATGLSLDEKPYSTCPPMCFIAPEACGECKTYKEALREALLDVEDLEAYYSNFVLDPDAMPGGERECWYCGAPALASSRECEYCGSELGNGRSLVRVRSKEDVPDPIAKATNIIYERQKMAARYQKEKGSGGLLKGLLGLGQMAGQKMNAFDKPMTVLEVKETAQAYGVSVVTYLSGLDTGTYLTKAGKANQEAMNQINQQLAQQNAQRAAAFNAAQAQTAANNKSYTAMDWMAKRAETSAPQYSGGVSRSSCCGTCRYYIASSKECLYFTTGSGHYRSGPNDYCNNHRS